MLLPERRRFALLPSDAALPPPYDFAAQPGMHRPPANDLRERVYTPVLFACVREDAAGRRLRVLLRDDGRPLAAPTLAEAGRLLARTGAFAAAA